MSGIFIPGSHASKKSVSPPDDFFLIFTRPPRRQKKTRLFSAEQPAGLINPPGSLPSRREQILN
jgi:hypothetical protein